MKDLLLKFVACGWLAVAFFSCASRPQQKGLPAGDPADSLAAVEPLHGLDSLNDIAAIISGMPVDSTSKYFYFTKQAAWKKHSQSISALWAKCEKSLDLVKTFCRDSIPDVDAKCKTVLYTFSGPDLAYPSVIFPSADTIIMAAQEHLGKVVEEKDLNAKTFDAYSKALSYHLNNSYFITKDMMSDLGHHGLGGVTPIFMFYLSRLGYSIISIGEEGTNCLKINYFRPGENKEKVLYYYKVNLLNGQMSAPFKKRLAGLDAASTAGLLKACSYCMHSKEFTEIRDAVLRSCFAVVQDDTGPRYRDYAKDTWNVSLFGGYTTPLPVFGNWVYQKDLQKAYDLQGNKGNLPFRFGYNRKSSFIVARKKSL